MCNYVLSQTDCLFKESFDFEFKLNHINLLKYYLNYTK